MFSLLARSLYRTRFRALIKSKHFSLSCAVNSAVQNVNKNDQDCIVVKWKNGNINEYPYLYLRENCRCPSCYKDERKVRTMFVPKEIDLNVKADTVHWNAEDEKLEVVWGDGHNSQFSFERLQFLRYRPLEEDESSGVIRKGIELWGEEVKENLQTFQFDALMNDDKELYKWLVSMTSGKGIAKIENAPKDNGLLWTFGKRVGYLAEHGYGAISDVKAYGDHATHENSNSEAYLAAHTDLPYYNIVPMVELFHCIEQSKGEGGDNLWVDGFNAANILYEEDPESFQLLATTSLQYHNFTKTPVGPLYSVGRHPVISLDDEMKLKQVFYGEEYRYHRMPLEPKLMKSFYKAYFHFSELLYENKKTSFWYKMKPGDIMTANNYRVLHGRSAFQNQAGDSVRSLQISYLDLDCVNSKIRFLAEKQGIPSPVDFE